MDHINPDGKDMGGADRNIDLLHIHAQYHNHTEAWIVGNMGGLIKLRDALNKVIEKGKSVIAASACREVFVTDGEGYDIFIVRNDNFWEDKTWDQAALPYTDTDMGIPEMNEGGLWPHEMLSEDQKNLLYGVSDEVA